MKAIRTRYFPPTTNRNARFVAEVNDGSHKQTLYISKEEAEERAQILWQDTHWDMLHKIIAYKLANLLNWEGCMIGGVFKNDYYWVFK